MRVPPVERRRRGGFRIRGWMIAIVVVLVVLFLSPRGLAGFYTDYLWFDSVGFGTTWRGLLSARFAPTAVFTVLFFVLMLVNLTIADRLAPRTRSMGPEDELLARYQQSSGRTPAGSASASPRSSRWSPAAASSASGSSGSCSPTRSRLRRSRTRSSTRTSASTSSSCRSSTFIFDWLFAGAGHRADRHRGRALPERRDPAPEPVPAGHAAGEGAPLGDPRADGAGEDRAVLLRPLRAELLRPAVSSRARATPTSKAQLPALNLLIVISIVAAALFIWNIWRRGWVLPIIAVGLWAFVSLVIGTIYPASIQQFVVQPERVRRRSARTSSATSTATRDAFGLDKVDGRRASTTARTSAAQSIARRTSTTIDNARLWDPPVIRRNVPAAPGAADLLPDRRRRRRPLRDRRRDDARSLIVGARAQQRRPPEPDRGSTAHLVYTHGYGAVASPANAAESTASPTTCSATSRRRGEHPARRRAAAASTSARTSTGYVARRREVARVQLPARRGDATPFTRYTGDGRRRAVELRCAAPRSRCASATSTC